MDNANSQLQQLHQQVSALVNLNRARSAAPLKTVQRPRMHRALLDDFEDETTLTRNEINRVALHNDTLPTQYIAYAAPMERMASGPGDSRRI
jgi:hypothetical protein